MMEPEQAHTISCGCDSGNGGLAFVVLVCACKDDTDEGLRILYARESAPPLYQYKRYKGRRFWPTKSRRWRKG